MKALIVKTSSLGDLFHALPVAHRLKQDLGAEIHWLVNAPYVDLVQCFDPVDRAIPFQRRHALATAPALVRTLRRQGYDWALDLQGLLKSAVLARLAGAQRTIGPSFHREGARFFYGEIVGRRNKNRHAVDEMLEMCHELGLQRKPAAFPITLPDDAAPVAPSPLRIALLPQSRWASKNWPVASFVRLALDLKETCRDAALYLLGDRDGIPVCRTVEQALDGSVFNMCGRTGLVQTATLLRSMHLLIANDSGPVHMAAALGTPVLAIFGSTDPLRTGPYGSGHRVIKTALPCQPCFARQCQRGDLACLQGISPEKVRDTALAMLACSASKEKT
jgi:heptosyltransferase I